MAYAFLRRLILPPILRHVGSVEGVEQIPLRGPFILACNHVSYVEPAFVAMLGVSRTKERVYSLTKIGVWKIFHVTGLSDYLGMVPVDPKERAKAIDLALPKLERGYPVMIFPEGKRNYDRGTLLPARTGAARLALLSGAPVIPIAYFGPSLRSTWQALFTFFGKGKSLKIKVGTPLSFPKTPGERISKELLDDVSRQIMAAIAQLLGTTYSF